ncbi:hypothetical protein ACQP1W_24830 [Spirillospora sp. CA-255316]
MDESLGAGVVTNMDGGVDGGLGAVGDGACRRRRRGAGGAAL